MRVVLFTDVNGPGAARLLPAIADEVAGRTGWQIAAVVTSRPDAFRETVSQRLQSLFGRALRAAVNVGDAPGPVRGASIDLVRFCRRRSIEALASRCSRSLK